MATFTDWLAATFYTSDEEVQLHKDVAADQQANLDASLAKGNVDYPTYYQTTNDIQAAGTFQEEFKEENSGTLAFLSTFPWWFWPLVLGGVWLYLGAPGLSALKGKFK